MYTSITEAFVSPVLPGMHSSLHSPWVSAVSRLFDAISPEMEVAPAARIDIILLFSILFYYFRVWVRHIILNGCVILFYYFHTIRAYIRYILLFYYVHMDNWSNCRRHTTTGSIECTKQTTE